MKLPPWLGAKLGLVFRLWLALGLVLGHGFGFHLGFGFALRFWRCLALLCLLWIPRWPLTFALLEGSALLLALA